MKTFSLVLGMVAALAVLGLLLVLVVNMETSSTKPEAYRYDPAKETAVRGMVLRTEEFSCPVSGEMGGHFMLDKPRLQIHLAPGRVLRANQIAFAPGDMVEVVGSPVRFRGEEGLIARDVTRGNVTYHLRDASGNLIVTQYR